MRCGDQSGGGDASGGDAAPRVNRKFGTLCGDLSRPVGSEADERKVNDKARRRAAERRHRRSSSAWRQAPAPAVQVMVWRGAIAPKHVCLRAYGKQVGRMWMSVRHGAVDKLSCRRPRSWEGRPGNDLPTIAGLNGWNGRAVTRRACHRCRRGEAGMAATGASGRLRSRRRRGGARRPARHQGGGA